jgi:nitrite reductase/ring-hydroxylating ferredoxin subunit/uncharacterized membrane protein
MRSKASFRGHPVHPALIPFPLAFLSGAVGFDLAGVLLDRQGWWTTGGHLAAVGILAALLAAVPGAIDYFATVPPQSSGRRRATKHALANLSAVALFALAWVLRGDPEVPPEPPLLFAEVLGFGLLMIGGWMGGTLTSRNQIGVDHRYAGAGKWREERVEADGGAVRVASADELAVDQMKLLHVDGRRIVLARTGDGYAAFDDRCPHRGGSLAAGVMICGTVQCPWHGSQFDARTGELRAGPAEAGIAVYSVEETDGEVRLRM